MTKLTIKQIPKQDRPYEKYEMYGAQYLTDAELLAVIIKNGSKELNCLDISKYILSNHLNGLSGFNYIKQASLDELMQIPGIGKVKAIQLKCVMELANRINLEDSKVNRNKITCPLDVFNLVKGKLKGKEVEELLVVILDNKSYVKSIVTVSKGSTNKTAVSPKEVLNEPIKQLGTSIVLVHNHPSGDTTPSRQDILLTKKIADYASIFEINLFDHIIVGKNNYTSLKETNGEVFLGGRIL